MDPTQRRVEIANWTAMDGNVDLVLAQEAKIGTLPRTALAKRREHKIEKKIKRCVHDIIITKRDANILMRTNYTGGKTDQNVPFDSPPRAGASKGEVIYDKAIKLLSIRMHTTGELMRKLKAKGYKDQDILPVLQKLEELKFLDDARFAEIFVDNLKRYKDWGYYGIRAKLAARQIPNDLAIAALGEFFSAEDELIVANRLMKKLSAKTYEQKARGLTSRGFRTDIIKKALD